MKLNLYIVLKTVQGAVAEDFIPADALVNLNKSLEKKLPFDLFSKYACIFFEPVIKNDIYTSIDIKGLVLQITSIHDWASFIPKTPKKEAENNILTKVGNTLSLKVVLNNMVVDYTPCVSNSTILQIYKNYEYKVDTEENSDSSDGSVSFNKAIYKTNTRLVSVLDNATIDLSISEEKIDIAGRLTDLSVHLLNSSDYSPKWSGDLLLDFEKCINSIQQDLLSKMGFVNVITVRKFDISMIVDKSDIDPDTNKPSKKSKSIASLPDIYERENLELPTILLSKDQEDTSKVEIKLNFSEILVFCCHDSLLGFMLFSKAAGLHISKALRKISKRSTESTVNLIKDDKVFASVIKEEDDDSDGSDHSPKGIKASLHDYIMEEEKFGTEYVEDPKMEKNLSDFSKDVKNSYDIIDFDDHSKKRDFLEGSVTFNEKINLISDYLDASEEQETTSKWHNITTPKSEISSGIARDHVTVPKLKI